LSKNCEDERALSTSLTVLEKRGLISLRYESTLINLTHLEESDLHYDFAKYLEKYGSTIINIASAFSIENAIYMRRGFATLTNYGQTFLAACIERDKASYILEGMKKSMFSISGTDIHDF